MNKITIILLCFAFLLCEACRDSEKYPDTSETIVFPQNVNDTIIYIQTSKVLLPVVIHIPVCSVNPLPAVVVMHGSGGMWKDNIPGIEISKQSREWRDLLDDECVISVFVDSYSPRAVLENSGDYKNPPKTFEISGSFVRPKDAYVALSYISKIKLESTNDFLVKKSGVAILGFSHGGTTTESTIFDNQFVPEDWMWTQKYDGVVYDVPSPYERPNGLNFKAAVAYYPGSFHRRIFWQCLSAR